MTITERTLKEWRRQALHEANILRGQITDPAKYTCERLEISERILRLTQELLDMHLMKRYQVEKKS